MQVVRKVAKGGTKMVKVFFCVEQLLVELFVTRILGEVGGGRGVGQADLLADCL